MSDSVVEKQLAAILGRRLQQLRVAKGLSQDAVANEAGISRQHYQLLESGWGKREGKTPANPRLSTLIALSRVLDTTVPALVNDIFGSLDADVYS
ncbi:helix-turn-helix domain-containing protein [Prescottella subtropica]|uniref:helix-turn-helix domain-containing protein n=1 Tax=Prescottella subtropica TaxID=2545757 RepID=UPI0010F9188A|nr:helix-turn-helix transcriptional regulator [Prescottella subtropica]